MARGRRFRMELYRLFGQTGFGASTTGGAAQTLTPAYYNGTVYGASNLRAVAWNISDGRVLWERWLTHNTYSSPAISATIESTKVYIGGDSGSVHILDGSTGKVLYSYHTVGIVASSPAVCNLSLIHISEPTRLGMISYA